MSSNIQFGPPSLIQIPATTAVAVNGATGTKIPQGTNSATIQVSGLAAETLTINISVDGGATFSATALGTSLISVNTLGLTLTNGTYYIPIWMPGTHWKITKSAGVNTVTVQILFGHST